MNYIGGLLFIMGIGMFEDNAVNFTCSTYTYSIPYSGIFFVELFN